MGGLRRGGGGIPLRRLGPGARGMAAAALWDASPPSGGEAASRMRTKAQEISEELLTSRALGNVAWGSLIRAAGKGGGEPLLTETPFRWIQWGWLE